MFTMNKIVKLFVALFITVYAASGVSYADDSAISESKFKEGEHYRTIESNELSSNQQMVEFFSFYCGHCFMFRSLWSDLQVSFPNVEFSKRVMNNLNKLNNEVMNAVLGIEEEEPVPEVIKEPEPKPEVVITEESKEGKDTKNIRWGRPK